MKTKSEKPAPKQPVFKGSRIISSMLNDESHVMPRSIERALNTAEHSVFAENTHRRWRGMGINREDAGGAGHWEFFCFADDFYLVISNFHYQDLRTDHILTSGMVEFHVKISGHTSFRTREGEAIEVESPAVVADNYPEGLEWDIALHPEQETSLTFFISPDYFYDNLLMPSEGIPTNLARFLLSHEASINHCQLPITSEILDAASSIINSSKSFKNLQWLHHVHGRCEELISHIVAAFDKLDATEQNAYSQVEIEQLRKAKQILSEQFETPPIIPLLARQVGSSETKLKRGFKSLFGETIFECRNRQRMKKALQLLGQDLPIVEVAKQVGYQHQASFTNAFKAYFNMSPMECRKRLWKENGVRFTNVS